MTTLPLPPVTCSTRPATTALLTPITVHTLPYTNSALRILAFFLDSWPLKMGTTGCPETSVRNYHHLLRNNPEERSFHLLRCGSPTSIRVNALMYAACNAHAPYYIVIFGLPGSTIFFHIMSQRGRFSKNKSYWTQNVCLIVSTNLSETFLILRRTKQDSTKHRFRFPCKVPLFLSEFSETWLFSTDFGETFVNQILQNSVQWEPSCSMLSDGRTDNFEILRRRLKFNFYKVFFEMARKNKTVWPPDDFPPRPSPTVTLPFCLFMNSLLRLLLSGQPNIARLRIPFPIAWTRLTTTVRRFSYESSRLHAPANNRPIPPPSFLPSFLPYAAFYTRLFTPIKIRLSIRC